MSGKGSARRPKSVSQKQFELNWELTFNKQKYENAMQELTELSEELGLYEPTKNSLCQKKSKKKKKS